MINVSYRAYDSRSNVQEGTIAAATEQAAIDALYELGLTPYETQIVGRPKLNAQRLRRGTRRTRHVRQEPPLRERSRWLEGVDGVHDRTGIARNIGRCSR